MALTDNKAKIQALLDGINALPEAGSGEAPAPVLQEKAVTPTETAQSITPDAGYDGLSEVNVGAIPDEYIVPSGTVSITANGTHNVREAENVNVNVPAPEIALQEKTVTPTESTLTVTPDSGYDGLSQVTVNGDANLVPDNIKSGVSIFAVVGSYEGSSSGSPGGSVETCTFTVSGGMGIRDICYVGVGSDGGLSVVEDTINDVTATITCVRGSIVILRMSSSYLLYKISASNCERVAESYIINPNYACKITNNAETASIAFIEAGPT